MPIWVDADACPIPVKEILYRAAHRAQVVTTLVANQGLKVPPSPFIKTQQVEKGFDVADHVIAQQVKPGDLVITGLPVNLRPLVPTPLVTASDLGVDDTPSAVLWPDGSIRVYGGAYGSEAWPWLGGTSALPGSA